MTDGSNPGLLLRKIRFVFSWSYVQAFLLAVFLLSACAEKVGTTSLIRTSTEPAEVVLLQLNDVYEISPLEHGTVGGMARVAQLKKDLLETHPHTLVVHAGDFLSPSAIGTVKLGNERIQGAQMVDVMNSVGIDYVTFGNHEFDLKLPDLQKRMNESRFEWISSNVLRKTEGHVEPFYRMAGDRKIDVAKYKVVSFPGKNGGTLRMGLIAVTLPLNQQSYVVYEDVFQKAKEAYDEVSKQSDFVIAITHLFLEQDMELARRLPELALIIGGHDHENSFNVVGTVPIAKADANAKSVYVHQINFNRATGTAEVSSKVQRLDATVPPDKHVAELVKKWESKAYEAFLAQGFDLQEQVAVLREPLDGLESHIRAKQTNLGDLITRAMLDAAGDADLAILNSGSIRIDDYVQGPVTQLDLIRILPFGGAVLKVRMKGTLLQRVLDVGRSNVGTGGFLHTANVSGMKGSWLVSGAPIDSNRVYSVAITDFLMSGKENNLEFLLDNSDVVETRVPSDTDPLRDVRLVLLNYMRK